MHFHATKQVQTENNEPMFLFTFGHTDSLFLCVRACVLLGASSCMTSLRKCVPPDTRTPRSKAWIMCLSSAQIKTVREHHKSYNEACYLHLLFGKLPPSGRSPFGPFSLALCPSVRLSVSSVAAFTWWDSNFKCACPSGESEDGASWLQQWGLCKPTNKERWVTQLGRQTDRIVFPQNLFQCHAICFFILLPSATCQRSPSNLLQCLVLTGQLGAMNEVWFPRVKEAKLKNFFFLLRCRGCLRQLFHRNIHFLTQLFHKSVSWQISPLHNPKVLLEKKQKSR